MCDLDQKITVLNKFFLLFGCCCLIFIVFRLHILGDFKCFFFFLLYGRCCIIFLVFLLLTFWLLLPHLSRVFSSYFLVVATYLFLLSTCMSCSKHSSPLNSFHLFYVFFFPVLLLFLFFFFFLGHCLFFFFLF